MIRKSPRLKALLTNIQKADNILLLTHRNPDADALGSTQALKNLLLLLGKNPKCAYLAQSRKPPHTIMADPTNVVYETAPQDPKIELDLTLFDYAICLDTSYSDHNITGFKFKSAPPLGVGTIDHHTRSDLAFFPEQDFNLPDASATCEIVYQLIPTLLALKQDSPSYKELDDLPKTLKQKIAGWLLPGILDDIVGLTVFEKITDENLTMMSDLKALVGSARFRRMLTRSRTLRLPGKVSPYARYLTHHLVTDSAGLGYEIYFLAIPQKYAAVLKKSYSSVLTLLEHYARTSCQQQLKRYGMFVMTIEKFDPSYSKFSARGPLIKDIFQPARDHRQLFLSYGISGNSAMGGKIRTETIKDFRKNFLDCVQDELDRKALHLHELDTELMSRLEILVSHN